MKLLRRLLPIASLIIVFTPGILVRGCQINISKPVYISIVSVGLAFAILSMILKKEK